MTTPSLTPPPPPIPGNEARAQNFGVQASRFSLYAPLVALGLGLCTMSTHEYRPVGIFIGVLNLVLIFAGFVLGIVALCTIRKYGSKGILGRAIGGLVLCGLLLLAAVFVFSVAARAGGAKQQVVGHW